MHGRRLLQPALAVLHENCLKVGLVISAVRVHAGCPSCHQINCNPVMRPYEQETRVDGLAGCLGGQRARLIRSHRHQLDRHKPFKEDIEIDVQEQLGCGHAHMLPNAEWFVELCKGVCMQLQQPIVVPSSVQRHRRHIQCVRPVANLVAELQQLHSCITWPDVESSRCRARRRPWPWSPSFRH